MAGQGQRNVVEGLLEQIAKLEKKLGDLHTTDVNGTLRLPCFVERHRHVAYPVVEYLSLQTAHRWRRYWLTKSLFISLSSQARSHEPHAACGGPSS